MAEVIAAVREHAVASSSVGVVVPDPLFDEVEEALRRADLPFGDADRGGLTDVVTVLRPPDAKGLEFDAVVAVEPAGFLTDGPVGGRLLYIALTRAVQELTIIHSAPLPAGLAG